MNLEKVIKELEKLAAVIGPEKVQELFGTDGIIHFIKAIYFMGFEDGYEQLNALLKDTYTTITVPVNGPVN